MASDLKELTVHKGKRHDTGVGIQVATGRKSGEPIGGEGIEVIGSGKGRQERPPGEEE